MTDTSKAMNITKVGIENSFRNKGWYNVVKRILVRSSSLSEILSCYLDPLRLTSTVERIDRAHHLKLS